MVILCNNENKSPAQSVTHRFSPILWASSLTAVLNLWLWTLLGWHQISYISDICITIRNRKITVTRRQQVVRGQRSQHLSCFRCFISYSACIFQQSFWASYRLWSLWRPSFQFSFCLGLRTSWQGGRPFSSVRPLCLSESQGVVWINSASRLYGCAVLALLRWLCRIA